MSVSLDSTMACCELEIPHYLSQNLVVRCTSDIRSHAAIREGGRRVSAQVVIERRQKYVENHQPDCQARVRKFKSGPAARCYTCA